MEAGPGAAEGNGPTAVILPLGPSRAGGVRHHPASPSSPPPFAFISHPATRPLVGLGKPITLRPGPPSSAARSPRPFLLGLFLTPRDKVLLNLEK